MSNVAEPSPAAEGPRGGEGSDDGSSSGGRPWLRPLLLRLGVLVLAVPVLEFIAGFFGLHVAWAFPARIVYMVVVPVIAAVVAFRALPGRWVLRLLGALLAGPVMFFVLLFAVAASSALAYPFGLRTAVRSGVNIDLPAVLEWSERAVERYERGELRQVETSGVIDGVYYYANEVHPDEVGPGVMTGRLERRGFNPGVFVERGECVEFRWYRSHGIRVCPRAEPGEQVDAFGF